MSQKYLFFVVLFSIATVGTSLEQICPPPDELSYCDCNEDKLQIHCHGGDPLLDLKAEFDRMSSFINSTVVFEELLINGVIINEIKADTIVSLKFNKVTITYNDHLTSIHANAFPGTYDTTTELILSQNELDNENNATNIFDFVNNFKNVESVIMDYNNIRYIPDDPFNILPNLKNLHLKGCRLLGVGSRIFANLPNLEKVVMSYCDISLNEFNTDTFEGIGANVLLDLEFNPFSRVPEQIFRHVLDNAMELRVGGDVCIIECDKYKVLLDCDEQANWICENETVYREKIVGFYCRDGNDVWNYCLQNNNTTIF